MRKLLSLVLLLLAGCSTPKSPSPPIPLMAKSTTSKVMMDALVVSPPTATRHGLQWDYPSNVLAAVEFEVWHKPNNVAVTNWAMIAVTTNKFLWFDATNDCDFFIVRARLVADTNIVSPWNIK